MINFRRRWLYQKDKTGKIFEKDEPIGAGWYESPDCRADQLVGDAEGEPLKADPEKEIVTAEDVVLKIEIENQPKSEYNNRFSVINGIKRYVAHMNQAELIEHGKHMGLTFDKSMGTRAIREAIYYQPEKQVIPNDDSANTDN